MCCMWCTLSCHFEFIILKRTIKRNVKRSRITWMGFKSETHLIKDINYVKQVVWCYYKMLQYTILMKQFILYIAYNTSLSGGELLKVQLLDKNFWMKMNKWMKIVALFILRKLKCGKIVLVAFLATKSWNI